MTADLGAAVRAWLTENAPTVAQTATVAADTGKPWIEGWAAKQTADITRAAALADADPSWLETQPAHTRTAVATWRARQALKGAR